MVDIFLTRFSCLLLVVIAVFFSPDIAAAQTKVPRFQDFPATEFHKSPNASPVITRNDRKFRTRLRDAAKEKPNFAGRYILTSWGCGAQCLIGAVIDAKTGKIYWQPHTTCCWETDEENFYPIVFQLNSRLIIFSGLRNESENDTGYDSHFYEFRNGRFIFIKTVKRKNGR